MTMKCKKGKWASIASFELSIASMKEISEETETPIKELILCALDQGCFVFGICKIENLREAKITAVFVSETIRGICV